MENACYFQNYTISRPTLFGWSVGNVDIFAQFPNAVFVNCSKGG